MLCSTVQVIIVFMEKTNIGICRCLILIECSSFKYILGKFCNFFPILDGKLTFIIKITFINELDFFKRVAYIMGQHITINVSPYGVNKVSSPPPNLTFAQIKTKH